MVPIRTILYATDFSDCSRCAFGLASAVARAQKARLVVLHVKPKPDMLMAYADVLADMQPEDYEEGRLKLLHALQVKDPAVVVEHRLVEGDPAPEIVRIAEEIGTDVIVMGTHGRKGLDRLILGSVAESVLRKAACPVVTVRLPQHHPAATAANAGAEGVGAARL
jgi:nucleotide-binding universal stress UspA family protein